MKETITIHRKMSDTDEKKAGLSILIFKTIIK